MYAGKHSRKAKRDLGRIIVKARRVLANQDKEGGKGNHPENYKQVRLKLQGDRLNRGWRDRPNRGTAKGRNRPHFAQVEDLLTRTRCFKCGELGHLARNCSQKKEDDQSLFSGDKKMWSQDPRPFSVVSCAMTTMMKPFLPTTQT